MFKHNWAWKKLATDNFSTVLTRNLRNPRDYAPLNYKMASCESENYDHHNLIRNQKIMKSEQEQSMKAVHVCSSFFLFPAIAVAWYPILLVAVQLACPMEVFTVFSFAQKVSIHKIALNS